MNHRRHPRGAAFGAALVSFALLAAACGDKKNDTGGTDTTAPRTGTTGTGGSTIVAVDTAPPGTDGTGSTVGTAEGTDVTSGTDVTTSSVDETPPVMGGTLIVSGDAEVAQPWTPAAVQCDPYCYERARTFYDTIASYGRDQKVHGVLAESIEPNDDFTEWTIKVRPGITFHDGTPLDADAMIYNLQETGGGILAAAALTDVAKVPSAADPTKMELKIEKADDMTFTIFTGKGGDPNKPLTWPGFPAFLTSQVGFVASPTWLKAVKDGTGDPAKAVGTGPFILQSYAPREATVVTRNPNYWQKDADGNQLPYLDKIEFRVIEDSETARDALRSGDIDIFSTSNARVIADFQATPDEFPMNLQEKQGETFYIIMDQGKKTPLNDRRVRCALSMAIDRQELIDVTGGGILTPANGLFSPGQQGYLADNGLSVEQDIEGAQALIDEYLQETGQSSINLKFGQVTGATTEESTQLIQGYWQKIGVNITPETIPQDQYITNAALGAENFLIQGWRQHAGVSVDQQYVWWHSSSAHPDGQISLNFGRLNDPVIDENLDKARTATDPAVAKEAAEAVNREFVKECWYIPLSWAIWGTPYAPKVHGIGPEVLPDGELGLDGSQSAGQFRLQSVFISE